jgi:hypothetical protein
MPIQSRPDITQAIAALVGLLALLAIHIVLARQAVADLTRDDRRVRIWSKQAWFVVITLAAIIGPVAYFSFGREDGR